jgi:hypothetical protein
MAASFLLFDRDDVSLFKTVEALAAYVESPDLEGYLATDSGGRIVRLEPSTQAKCSRVGLVSVMPVKATLTIDVVAESQLRGRLLSYLHQLGALVDETSPVEKLVREIEERIGYTE